MKQEDCCNPEVSLGHRPIAGQPEVDRYCLKNSVNILCQSGLTCMYVLGVSVGGGERGAVP